MPSNGELSKKLGAYRTLCCDAEIVIGAGVIFPDCPNHLNLTTEWKELVGVDPVTYEPKPNKFPKSDNGALQDWRSRSDPS